MTFRVIEIIITSIEKTKWYSGKDTVQLNKIADKGNTSEEFSSYGKFISRTKTVLDEEIKQTFVYDEKGLVKFQKMEMMGQNVEMPFSDDKFDNKGNWISSMTFMMGQEMEMKRSITYYDF